MARHGCTQGKRHRQKHPELQWPLHRDFGIHRVHIDQVDNGQGGVPSMVEVCKDGGRHYLLAKRCL